MKKIIMMLIGLSLVAVFTACGGGSGGSSNSTPELLTDENQSYTVAEGSSFSFDSTLYIQNASSYSVEGNTDLNITIVDSNVSIVIPQVDVTTTYTFVVRGSDDENNSVVFNISVEVVDGLDDSAIVISDVEIAESITYGDDLTFSLTANDPDGMLSVTTTIKDSTGSNTLYFRIAYPDVNNSNTIDVSELFSELETGSYSIVVTAEGIIGGEGERSSFTTTYDFEVEAFVPDDVVAPVLSMGDMTYSTALNNALTLQTLTAVDDVDGSVTVIQTGSVNFNATGTYSIVYTATDSAGNSASVTHTYTVTYTPPPSDTTPPVLSMGDASYTTPVGTSLTLKVLTATDNVDGNVPVVRTGSVNFDVVNTYYIIYTATDSAGNSASSTHTYIVRALTAEEQCVADGGFWDGSNCLG